MSLTECEIRILPPSPDQFSDQEPFEMGKRSRKHKKHPKQKLNNYGSVKQEYYDYEIQKPKVESDDQSSLILFIQGLLGNGFIRSNIYLISALIFSYIAIYIQDYQSLIYTAQPKNVFNEYFVKFAWGWNLALVTPFATLTSTYSAKKFFAALVRIGIATGIWYGLTNLFIIIRKSSESDLDISGHSFILVWGVLFIIEEAKSYNSWKSNFTGASKPSLTFIITLNLILLTAIVLLWDIMFLSTVVFYHTMAEKFLAVLFAEIAWILTYQGIYTLPIGLNVA